MKFDNRQLIKDFILLKKLQINKWLPHKAVQIKENTNFDLYSGKIYKQINYRYEEKSDSYIHVTPLNISV